MATWAGKREIFFRNAIPFRLHIYTHTYTDDAKWTQRVKKDTWSGEVNWWGGRIEEVMGVTKRGKVLSKHKYLKFQNNKIISLN